MLCETCKFGQIIVGVGSRCHGCTNGRGKKVKGPIYPIGWNGSCETWELGQDKAFKVLPFPNRKNVGEELPWEGEVKAESEVKPKRYCKYFPEFLCPSIGHDCPKTCALRKLGGERRKGEDVNSNEKRIVAYGDMLDQFSVSPVGKQLILDAVRNLHKAKRAKQAEPNFDGDDMAGEGKTKDAKQEPSHLWRLWTKEPGTPDLIRNLTTKFLSDISEQSFLAGWKARGERKPLVGVNLSCCNCEAVGKAFESGVYQAEKSFQASLERVAEGSGLTREKPDPLVEEIGRV